MLAIIERLILNYCHLTLSSQLDIVAFFVKFYGSRNIELVNIAVLRHHSPDSNKWVIVM